MSSFTGNFYADLFETTAVQSAQVNQEVAVMRTLSLDDDQHYRLEVTSHSIHDQERYILQVGSNLRQLLNAFL